MSEHPLSTEDAKMTKMTKVFLSFLQMDGEKDTE